FGDVPIRLTPVRSVEEAGTAVRSSVADVYTQILADLSAAEGLITATVPATQATAGAVDALTARVQLYRGDYAAALAETDEVLGQGYELAGDYAELFDPEGQDTPEDIFKVIFTAVQFTNVGYYYITEDEGGLGAVGPAQDLIDSFDPDDARLAWDILGDSEGSASGTKFPTTAGAEDFHVIRLAEVLLIRAEAQARLTDLDGAVDTYNQLRERAGLPPHSLGDEVTTPDEVLAAVALERRHELAFEGDRWPDLVRTGTADDVLGIPEFQTLLPVPQRERDVAPGLTQNPGY
ncbi:MAG TPA: RagB/SusD family nutrient uptake outer membrane protein, partial [Gemmatimonadales bacterium]|nr:RagB/SusD family nutrient uptake outer membrane protein [Gemmatimonadales bacterium]